MSVPKGNKKKENKTDPARFEGDGVSFKGKFIGVADVWDSHGGGMCQETMRKLKAAVKSSGEHKLRIMLNISLEGIKIIDEKTEIVNYTHMVNHISFVSKDASDSRAIGYVYGPGDGSHKFFAIKTEKSAEQVMFTVRDLFEVKKKELEEAAAREAAKNAEAEASKDGATVATDGANAKGKADDDHVYSGMDSIGTALAHSSSSPFGAAAALDIGDPWNVKSQVGSASQTPSPLLQPPPPVVRSNSSASRGIPSGAFPIPVVGQRSPVRSFQQSPIGSISPQVASAAFPIPMVSQQPTVGSIPQSPVGSISSQVAAAAFPMPVSSAFPPLASPGAAMPSGMFPMSSAAAAAASPPFASAFVGNQIIMQSPPKVPVSPSCALPVVTDPFGDGLFSSSTSAAQASIVTTPMPISQPFGVQPHMHQPAFAVFPQPGTTPTFGSSSPSGGFFVGSIGSTSSMSSVPSKFDVFSSDNFTSFDAGGFSPSIMQQTPPITSPFQDQALPGFGTQSLPTAAITGLSDSPGSDVPENQSVPPAATADTRLSPDTNLFDDLCNFGSKQPHKKPAELFPRLEPPVKKLNELIQETDKKREQQNGTVGTPSPLPNDVFSTTPFQASDDSIPSAGPSDDLLCDPRRLPEPSGSPLLSTDPAFFLEKSGNHSSLSSGIFSFSGNHSTEVTYAVTTPEPSEIEFNHPAPSHPPPPLPPSIALALSPNTQASPISSSTPNQKATVQSDDDEDFNLPAPAVPPPPLPSETLLSLAKQAPAPPPRPRPSEISKLPKPPQPKPRRNLSSSSSLQSMGKSSSPVPSTISQDGMTRADSGLAGSSVFSPSSPASDISNLSHSSAWADPTKFDSAFQTSSISPAVSLDNQTTNNNNSPQLWSTFTENENSSPSSNQSLSSGRDFFPTTSTATRASSVSSWPDNNPFVVKTVQSPSLTNTVSPSPKSTTVDFADAFTAFTTKSESFATISSKASSDLTESPSVDPFTISSKVSSDITKAPQVDPFTIASKASSDLTQAPQADPFTITSSESSDLTKTPPVDPFIISRKASSGLIESPKEDPFTILSKASSNIESPPVDSFKTTITRPSSNPVQADDPFVVPAPLKQKEVIVERDPFTVPSLAKSRSSSVPPEDPFVVPSPVPKLPLSKTPTDLFIPPPRPSSSSSTILTSKANPVADPFVIPCSSPLQSDNSQTDPFANFTQTKAEIDKVQTDPFVSPSSSIIPPNGTRTDPFEGFSQWSTPSSVNANVSTTNGCRKFSWETSFETEPIYAVVNKQK